MKTSARVLLACVLVVGWAGIAGAQEQAAVTIREVELEDFPTAVVTVSFKSGTSLNRSDISLSENGTPITSLRVEPLESDEKRIDVVLVIDTSGSMNGAPLRAAVGAARRFVESLPPEIGVGVVQFADEPRVLRGISLQREDVLKAISSLRASGETSLYDGTTTAARMFSGDGQRNIILLSDGADTVSRGTLQSALSAVKGRGTTVFSVGLRSGEFDARALRRLSQASGGRYAPAGNADLSQVYRGLAVELSNQFLITYRSGLAAGEELSLSLTVGNSGDDFLTLVPKKTGPPATVADPAPPPVEVDSYAVRGTWGMAVSLGLVFLAVFVALLSFFGFKYRDDRDRSLARLLGVAPSSLEPREESPSSQRALRWIPRSLIRVAGRITRREGFGSDLDMRLERAGLPISPEEFVATTIVAAVVGAAFGVIFLQSLLLAALSAGVAAVIPKMFLAARVRRRFRRLHSQLADVVMILASSIRAGHSFLQALDMVAREIGEPGASEFARVVAEIRLGRSVDDAMEAMAERIGSDDFKWAVLAVNIQREVGGNLAELLDLVADTLRERDDLRRQVDVLSAEGRLSVAILAALPILLLIYMSRVNAEYIGVLVGTQLGLLLLGVAGILWIGGFIWMRRIVKINV